MPYVDGYFVKDEIFDYVSHTSLKCKDKEAYNLLIELSSEFYGDRYVFQNIMFARRLGRYLQYMIEVENKSISDVLDDAIVKCDFERIITSEQRRLAIKFLVRIWKYGPDLRASTNLDGTTKKN